MAISFAGSLNFPGEESSKPHTEVVQRDMELNDTSKILEDVSKEFLEFELRQTPRTSSSLETVAGSDEDLERSIMEPLDDSHDPNPPILQHHGVAQNQYPRGAIRPPFYMAQGMAHMISYPPPPQNRHPDFRSMPFRPPPFQQLHVYYCLPMPMVNPIPAMIVKQIDYYFSECNLVKDMDTQGWVSISLIANFPRIKRFTQSIPFIITSLKALTIVEVKGSKIRKRDNWRYWVPPSIFAQPDN